jgi:thioredoxin reductase (NADPH)
LEGAGIYYSATLFETLLCGGEEVVVVGGGNSAGQPAVFLAQMAKRVHLLVRVNSLVASMSRYLIHRIEESPIIIFRLQTEVVVVDNLWYKERQNSVLLIELLLQLSHSEELFCN